MGHWVPKITIFFTIFDDISKICSALILGSIAYSEDFKSMISKNLKINSLLKSVKIIQKNHFQTDMTITLLEMSRVSILVFNPFLSEASKTPDFRVPNPSI